MTEFQKTEFHMTVALNYAFPSKKKKLFPVPIIMHTSPILAEKFFFLLVNT